MSAPDNTASIASTGHGCVDPLGGPDLLIDPHAHFHTPLSNRTDWMRYNASRLDFGERIGIRCHVASILGAWGHTSPTDFTSPHDQTLANDCMFDLAEREAPRVKAFVAVNPDFTAHALTEITRGMARGAVGIALAAGRRTTDFALLDDIASAAAQYGVPVLQHIWQHRRREWPNQEASDGVELAQLAVRHPRVTFLLAPIQAVTSTGPPDTSVVPGAVMRPPWSVPRLGPAAARAGEPARRRRYQPERSAPRCASAWRRSPPARRRCTRARAAW